MNKLIPIGYENFKVPEHGNHNPVPVPFVIWRK